MPPKASTQKQLHAVIHGRVQGVFYRAWTVETARSLGLAGWVRNRPDGAVELLAEGAEEVLQKFLALCHQGPPSAHVTAIEEEWSDEVGNHTEFSVMR